MAGFLPSAPGMTRNDPLCLLLCVLAAACGGTTEQASASDSGTRSATDSGLTQDSGPDAALACPAEAPSPASPCPTVGFECQYGTNFFPGGSQIATCTESGWELTGPPSGCMSSQCPASYAALNDGGLQTARSRCRPPTAGTRRACASVRPVSAVRRSRSAGTACRRRPAAHTPLLRREAGARRPARSAAARAAVPPSSATTAARGRRACRRARCEAGAPGSPPIPVRCPPNRRRAAAAPTAVDSAS